MWLATRGPQACQMMDIPNRSADLGDGLSALAASAMGKQSMASGRIFKFGSSRRPPSLGSLRGATAVTLAGRVGCQHSTLGCWRWLLGERCQLAASRRRCIAAPLLCGAVAPLRCCLLGLLHAWLHVQLADDRHPGRMVMTAWPRARSLAVSQLQPRRVFVGFRRGASSQRRGASASWQGRLWRSLCSAERSGCSQFQLPGAARSFEGGPAGAGCQRAGQGCHPRRWHKAECNPRKCANAAPRNPLFRAAGYADSACRVATG